MDWIRHQMIVNVDPSKIFYTSTGIEYEIRSPHFLRWFIRCSRFFLQRRGPRALMAESIMNCHRVNSDEVLIFGNQFKPAGMEELIAVGLNIPLEVLGIPMLVSVSDPFHKNTVRYPVAIPEGRKRVVFTMWPADALPPDAHVLLKK